MMIQNNYAIVDMKGVATAFVELTKGFVMQCNPETYARFLIEYNCTPLQADRVGYANFRFKRKNYKFHRWVLGFPDKKFHVDHIDADPCNNWEHNLRLATNLENMHNLNGGLHIYNTSGYRGVSWNKLHNKWEVYIWNKQQRILLGLYINLEEAIAVRQSAELRYNYTRTVSNDTK